MINKPHFIVVSLLALCLVIIKWPYLGLPSYWDEAYPYSYAIYWQVDHGLSLLPSSMPMDFSTGHPTLYYFLQACWIRLTGGGLFAARLLPLIFSVILLFTVYRAGTKILSKTAGLIAVMLLFSRSVFISQSAFMLPEILIALLTLLAFIDWYEEKRWRFALWGSLLLLTKEPSIMLVASLCIWEFIKWLKSDEKKFGTLIKNGLITAIPLFAAAFFFVVQFCQRGWFFYPRHFGAMSQPFSSVFLRIKEFIKMLFLYDGAFILFAILLISFGIVIIKKREEIRSKKILLGSFITFSVFFLLISSLNFYYSARYILCLYPLLFIVTAWAIEHAFSKYQKWLPAIIGAIIMSFQLFFTYNNQNSFDSTVGYSDRVKTQYSAIRWLVDSGYQKKNIYAEFLFMHNITDRAPGYVLKNEVFQGVTNDFKKANYFIATDIEPFSEDVKNEKKVLIKKWVTKNAWVELWEKKS